MDTATSSNSVALSNNSTVVTVVVARSTSFTSDTTSFGMLMDPSIATLTDKTRAVVLTVRTNANTGYTLATKTNQQLSDGVNTILAVPTTVSTASNSFTANHFGYAVAVAPGASSLATALGGLITSGYYAGYTLAGEDAVSSTTRTNGDTITITNRAKLDYMQVANTYTGTITYTVTPNY